MSGEQAKPKGRVVVVTPTRNRPEGLERVLESVLGQTAGDVVWAVVNDGGAVAPVEAVVSRARQAGLPTVVWHEAEAGGVAAARNRGLNLADSSYVAFLDDDDSWDAGFLAATLDQLARPPWWCASVTQTIRVTEDFLPGRGFVKGRAELWNPQIVDPLMVDLLGGWAPFTINAMLLHRAVVERIGGFDTSLRQGVDYAFFIRVIEQGNIGVLPRPLAFSHRRAEGDGPYAHLEPDEAAEPARAAVREALLLQDLIAGRPGIGVLASLSAGNKDLCGKLAGLQAAARDIAARTGGGTAL